VPDHGARTVEQLQENVGALGWTLSAEEIERLDRVSAVPEPSPYSFINGYTRKDSSPSSSGDA
jgi:diketogulonate reductase-like aldo/keto reductase